MNTRTKERVLVTDRVQSYGMGMDPRHALAISEAGDRIVVTGLNGGFMVYFVTNSCGIPYGYRFEQRTQPYQLCHGSDHSVGASLEGFRYAVYPRFLADDTTFLFEYRQLDWDVRTARASIEPLRGDSMYVALGDSFTSGEGEASDDWYQSVTTTDTSCHRSTRAYPYIWNAIALKMHRALLVACSGARLSDIVGSTPYDGQGNRLEEFNADEVASLKGVSRAEGGGGVVRQAEFIELYQPEQASVSIGGNDIGLMAKLKSCLSPGICEWATEQMRGQLAEEIDHMRGPLRSMLELLTAASPATQLVVVGYPIPIEAEESCHGVSGWLFTVEERELFSHSIQRLNRVLYEAARDLGVTYKDISHAFTGSGLCAIKSDSMNDIRFGDDIAPIPFLKDVPIFGAESFHPTFLGHQKIGHWLAHNAPMEAPALDEDYWDIVTAIDQARIRYAPEIGTLHDNQLVILDAPSGTFLANSTVRVTIQSEERELAVVQSNDDGSLTAQLSLPEDVSDGFHTVHLYGQSLFDYAVRHYFDVTVQTNSADEASITPDETNDTLRTPEASPTKPVAVLADSTPKQSQPLGQAERVLGAATELSNMHKKETDTHLLIALFTGLGIITAWYLYVRLLRK